MKKRGFIPLLLWFCALSFFNTIAAQPSQVDKSEMNLHGNISSILTTVRGSRGQIVGQPVRHIFNKNGNFEHVCYYDTLGTPVITVHYVYDKKGRLVKDTRSLEPFSELLAVTNYTFNRKRDTMYAEMIAINDSVCDHISYHYDKHGNLLQINRTDDKNNPLSRTNHAYDKKGRLLETTFYEGEHYLYIGEERFHYDLDGNLIQKASYYMERMRQCILYTYVFDAHGNWTTQYAYHVSPTSASLIQVTTRTITYVE